MLTDMVNLVDRRSFLAALGGTAGLLAGFLTFAVFEAGFLAGIERSFDTSGS